VKILLDMNLSPDWIAVLVAAGFEAVHWSSVGSIRAPDLEIMEFASLHGFLVLTHDLDFGSRLGASRAVKPSVVQIRSEDVYPEVIGPQVIAALREFWADLSVGALVTVDPNRTRLQLLPFGFRVPRVGDE
jgi:predicted nuclease of predicted toxin-antitoxin system